VVGSAAGAVGSSRFMRSIDLTSRNTANATITKLTTIDKSAVIDRIGPNQYAHSARVDQVTCGAS